MAGEMATAVASSHPTGMHSCCSCYFNTFYNYWGCDLFKITHLTSVHYGT